MGQPIGMHASEADKQADPVFTRFECIGLDFALTSLQDLTSAQLAVSFSLLSTRSGL